MGGFVLSFQEIDRWKIMAAGGKGANLGELSKIEGIRVPEGFCVTTAAYKKITESNQELAGLLDELARLQPEDRKNISEISAKIRMTIERIPLSADIAAEIAGCLRKFGERDAFAVRSSATAEDLPTASFAGQQDSYLNIIGKEAVLQHISKCWASLFTERAVIYRLQNGFDHHTIHLAVVVQQMVFPQAAGILFTADPVTSNRKMVSIDASFGLGEAIVSGLVNPDIYKVCHGKVTDKKISAKKLAIYASKDGGTKKQAIAPEMQNREALTDEQILQLEHMGRKIEAHFGQPQDIEWCLADDTFYIVQSRPITTLFPVPEAGDQDNHVYVSVGHQQMMTDAMKPLGLSFAIMPNPAPMRIAGGRIFYDVTSMLASPAGRKKVMDTLGKSDPLIKDALINILEREDFIRPVPDAQAEMGANGNKTTPDPGSPPPLENDPSIASDLIGQNQKYIEELKRKAGSTSGSALFDLISEESQQFRKILFDPQSIRLIMASINAAFWINEKINEWLGEKNVADIFAQSVPDNITSEMGLALLDVADAIRPYPKVIEYLSRMAGAKDATFLARLPDLEGGQEARQAIDAYLQKYGMRCAGEIDITKTRWSERPAMILPLILSSIRIFAPGESQRKFEHGRQKASKKEQEILFRLKQLPDGEQKAGETKRMIDAIRTFAGYREYPKYSMVSRYFVYKQALLKEAEHLVQARVIHEKEDIYYLTFEELREAVRAKEVDYRIICKRKEEYRQHEKLTPPRVITSDGEIVTGNYKREHLPPDAIVGLAVSSGVIEGRARVVLNMEEADIQEGDILVTAFTDPSWTPLFVSIKGLVTEVGGLMTHGAVIAREYGLPAVVGVENATRLIKDGQRIRVNGTDGYVEIL